jgi:predicted TIM-barrel fold metal-dependent hydrolase
MSHAYACVVKAKAACVDEHEEGVSVELKYGLISVDDHVQEPPDLWTQRLSRSKWGDRIPHVAQRENGTEYWVVDGQEIPMVGVALAGAAMPDRAREPMRWDEVPKLAYDPAERLKAMDVDGVDYTVLYPTVAGLAGETFGRLTDPGLELACAQAYNDWLIDVWGSVSARFIPQCIVPLAPIDATVQEIRRAVAKGHKGVVFPAVPMHLRDVPHINEPDYDPIWQTCQDLQVPVCFHSGSSKEMQFPAYPGLSPGLAASLEALTRPISSVQVVANFLYSRILLRYPELKVVFAETSLAWGAYEIETADHQFERQRLHLEGYALKPSEMFHRQCYMTGWYDRVAIEARRYLGVENILWGTSLPLATSSWPNTRDYIAKSFADVPEAEKSQMLWGNAAKLYRL